MEVRCLVRKSSGTFRSRRGAAWAEVPCKQIPYLQETVRVRPSEGCYLLVPRWGCSGRRDISCLPAGWQSTGWKARWCAGRCPIPAQSPRSSRKSLCPSVLRARPSHGNGGDACTLQWCNAGDPTGQSRVARFPSSPRWSPPACHPRLHSHQRQTVCSTLAKRAGESRNVSATSNG